MLFCFVVYLFTYVGCFGGDIKRLVFVYSYNINRQHTVEQDRGIRSGLMRQLYFEGVNLEVSRYYMDAKTVNRDHEGKYNVSQWIWSNFSNTAYDALVLFDDAAVDYVGVPNFYQITAPVFFSSVGQSPEKLNQSIPILLGPNGREEPSNNFTGCYERTFVFYTIQLFSYIITNLSDSTIVLLFDDDHSSKLKLSGIQEEEKNYQDFFLKQNITIKYVANLSTFDDYQSNVTKYVQQDPNVKLYYPNVYTLSKTPGSAEYVTKEDISEWTVQNILKPDIASMGSSEMGLFGGLGCDVVEMASFVGDMVGKYLSGTEIRKLPIFEPPGVLYFNLDRIHQLDMLPDSDDEDDQESFQETKESKNLDLFIEKYARFVYKKPKTATIVTDETTVVKKDDGYDKNQLFLLFLMFIPFVITCCCFWTVICGFLISCCCCGLLISIGTTITTRIGVSQKKKIKRFEKLEGFDILLREQEMEELEKKNRRTSIANLEINKDLFMIDMNEIKLLKIIGDGGSNSVVYKAEWNNQTVAFKSFRTQSISGSSTFEEFEKECKILSSISHPHVIAFYGATLKPPRVGIVMEFCERGDMKDFIMYHQMMMNGDDDDKTSHSYPLIQKIRLLMECSLGLVYLHSRNIIHRDLKLENVLIDSSEHCKLMDFGLSRIIEKMDIMKTTRIGTSIYMAPELCTDENYDEKVDCYSFSIMIFVLISEQFLPYGEENMFAGNIELRVAADPSFRPELKLLEDSLTKTKNPPRSIDDVKPENELKDMIMEMVKRCWSHDPNERYSFEKISMMLKSMYEKLSGINGNNESECIEKEVIDGIFSKSKVRMKEIEEKKISEEKCETVVVVMNESSVVMGEENVDFDDF